MSYNALRTVELDPKNEGEVLELALIRAYQSSNGLLSDFTPGSPLVAVLESLVYSHMEFLYWLNNLPDALITTYLSKALGAGINTGGYCLATISVTLTTVLNSPFILPAGSRVVSNRDTAITYLTTTTLTIPSGSTSGAVTVIAEGLGPNWAVGANELTTLSQSFAFLSSVTNSAASSVGDQPETLEEAQLRIQSLMSQKSPSSEEDWVNVVNVYFPNKAVNLELEPNSPVLSIFIEDYDPLSISAVQFNDYINLHKTLLQPVNVVPYYVARLNITITHTTQTPVPEECLNIASAISEFLRSFNLGTNNIAPQPVDIYKLYSSAFDSENLENFQVYYYDVGINTSIVDEPFSVYGYNASELVRDTSGNYFSVTTNFEVVNSPFDEAELGYLTYAPVYESLSSGYFPAGSIVLSAGTYYLMTSTAVFIPASPLDYATALSAPTGWNFGTSYPIGSFIKVASTSSDYSHGFIANISYTSASDWTTNLTPTTIPSKLLGNTANIGEYWYLQGNPLVVFRNDTASVYTVNNATLGTQTVVPIKAEPTSTAINHYLRYHSKYRVGTFTTDGNYVIISPLGERLPIVSGLQVDDLISSQNDPYGSLISLTREVYEVLTPFIPLVTDTVPDLYLAGAIGKAHKLYDDFDFLTVNSFSPYLFDYGEIYFKRTLANDTEKRVKKSDSNVVTIEVLP